MLEDIIQYMASKEFTPRNIKKVLNQFLSKRKCPSLKVGCIL